MGLIIQDNSPSPKGLPALPAHPTMRLASHREISVNLHCTFEYLEYGVEKHVERLRRERGSQTLR